MLACDNGITVDSDDNNPIPAPLKRPFRVTATDQDLVDGRTSLQRQLSLTESSGFFKILRVCWHSHLCPFAYFDGDMEHISSGQVEGFYLSDFEL